MTFIKLENLLGRSIKKAGITNQLDSVKILEEFDEVGQIFLGKQVMKKIKPLDLKDGTLFIACLSSVLAEKLKGKEGRILEELNRPYKTKVVEKLKFIV